MKAKLESLCCFSLAFVIFLLDQISKFYVVKYQLILINNIKVLENLNLVFVLNKGISFGFLSNLNISFYLGIVSIIISIFIIIWIIRSDFKIEKLSLSFILGGALGNGFDRINYEYVADFIDFHAYGFHWPAFNVADSFITLGGIMFILHSIKVSRR